MLIGGFQKFTMLDYPGKIAATVFTAGCNFCCPFCHNPELVKPNLIDSGDKIDEGFILDFLKTRKGDLDGICITGGEPTLQVTLIDFIKSVRKMGFLIKLDTNGSRFDVVSNLVKENLVDYWAIDIKTAPEKYGTMLEGNNVEEIIDNIGKSINLIIDSNNNLELRTTVVSSYVNLDDFNKMIDWINGVNKNIFPKLVRYSLQDFRPEKTLDDNFTNIKFYEKKDLEEMSKKIKKYCNNVFIASS